MNPGTSRLPLVATLVAISMATAGCTDAFTVHSIVENPDEPGPPHDLYGLWVRHAIEDSYLVLRIAPVSAPDRACEVAEVRMWEEPTSLKEAPLLEGRVCLTEVAGHTLVEISTLTGPVLYLQYLVRLAAAEISLCRSPTVWVLAKELAQGEASEAELSGLEYTQREAEEYEQIFLISDGEKLRAYLDANLPRIVEVCDEGNGKWEAFKRVAPVLKPDADATEHQSGGEPSEALPEP